MPFFAADNFSVGLDLDAEAFCIGSQITGKLNIECKEKTSIRGLVLIFKSTIKKDRDDPDDVKPIAELDIVLVGSRHGHSMDIPTGEYCYPFAIPLSTSLPPTCVLSDVANYRRNVSHYLSVAVIIARGLKDYCRTFPVTLLKAVHPTVPARQQAITRFHDAPSLYWGSFWPALARLIPGTLKSQRNSFQLTVSNPLVVLENSAVLHCRLRASILLHQTYICFRRRTVFADPHSSKVHRTDRELLRYPLDIQFGEEITNVSAEFSVTLPLQRSDPPTLLSAGVSISYYLVLRFTYSRFSDLNCCTAVLNEDEAKVPITVTHSVNEKAPLSNTMMWLPTKMSVHAAPQWSSGGSGTSSNEASEISRTASEPNGVPKANGLSATFRQSSSGFVSSVQNRQRGSDGGMGSREGSAGDWGSPVSQQQEQQRQVHPLVQQQVEPPSYRAQDANPFASPLPPPVHGRSAASSDRSPSEFSAATEAEPENRAPTTTNSSDENGAATFQYSNNNHAASSNVSNNDHVEEDFSNDISVIAEDRAVPPQSPGTMD